MMDQNSRLARLCDVKLSLTHDRVGVLARMVSEHSLPSADAAMTNSTASLSFEGRKV
jgi:hypothetical protein